MALQKRKYDAVCKQEDPRLLTPSGKSVHQVETDVATTPSLLNKWKVSYRL